MIEHYISVEEMIQVQKTSVCTCEDCRRYRGQLTGNNVLIPSTLVTNGKPLISIEELQEIEQQHKHAAENRQKIKIIDNTWCVCQQCGRQVKMLPEYQTISKEVQNVLVELPQLEKQLQDYEKEKGMHGYQHGVLLKKISYRKKVAKKIQQQPAVKQIPLEKRMPLYQRGEIFVCSQCFG